METIISVQHVVKKYKDITAVNNISFDVYKGEIFGFLGPNGAGKSTTIKMLTTLLQPTSGELMLAGKNVTQEQDAARKVFGIVFQDPSLDGELTALENLQLHAVLYKLNKKDAAKRIEELLMLVELGERKDSFVKTFSGGMKRRLEIARGLLHHPQILFLDEPTLGLDAQTRNLLWNYIKQLNEQEGMTIFFTTHYLGEAEEVADKIAIIDHGKIVALGTSEELRIQTQTDNLEKAYLQLTGTALRDETVSSTNSRREGMRRIMNR